jgi:hypothetical protein
VVNDAYARGAANAKPLLEELEEALAGNMIKALSSDKGTKALLKRNPELAKAIKAALGVDEAPAKTEEKPKSKTISRKEVEDETPPVEQKLSKKDRAAQIARELRAARERGEVY